MKNHDVTFITSSIHQSRTPALSGGTRIPFRWITILLMALLMTLGCSGSDSGGAQESLRKARLLLLRGDISEAESLARKVTMAEPGLADAWLLAAECAVGRGDFNDAVDDLSRISTDDSKAWLTARLLTADLLHHQLFRLRDAENAYRDVLKAVPNDVTANDGYARLLGVCGRRSEAVPYILQLLKTGEETDLLVLLSRESGMMPDPDLLEAARKADPTDPNPLIGQAVAAAGTQQPQTALKKLKQASELEGLPKSFHGLLGTQLLANRQFEDLNQWGKDFSADSATHDSWIVLATLAERAGDTPAAIRCYWEAVRLQPESLQAVNQLAQKLTSAGQSAMAEPFQYRVRQINELRDAQQLAIMSGPQPTFEDLLKMIQAYAAVGRFYEAYSWGKIAAKLNSRDEQLQQLMQTPAATRMSLPLLQTVPEHNPARQIDLSNYPLPALSNPVVRTDSHEFSQDILFQQQRSEIGFDFQYFSGSDSTTHRMFEFSGGGIAVIDFDHDGCPDLFCTQGILWDSSDSHSRMHHDSLFRNRLGNSFAEVSARSSMTHESGFGQGVATGDINNDGFADLYVANTGQNTLWVNNGDGTFSDHSAPSGLQNSDWTTSCLIADLNADGVPDLYDVNYLSGNDLFDRTCTEEHGDTIMCAPYDFESAVDRFLAGDGAGGFRDATAEFFSPLPVGKGLGVVAWNRGGKRLSLFVSNDTTANFFYTPDSDNQTQLLDLAPSAGLAFNGDGKAEACMGIAAADCTQDGQIDLFVTNFLYESNTLYSPVNKDLFEDKTRSLGLHENSLPVLGFGTQFLDTNLDGRFELFVANGFTQDLSKYSTPYRMQPQIFEWTGSGFKMLPPGQAGAWSRQEYVGRAVAKLDWNLDGKPDLAVGLLDDPSYVLTNTSTTQNQSLSLSLVAIETARDAIGTTVTATLCDQHFVQQLTAGDGYQCANQRHLIIGCGPAAVIDRLIVDWPSGTRQQFSDVPVSQSAVLVEGRPIHRIPNSRHSGNGKR